MNNNGNSSQKPCIQQRVQHHLLNWIVISRYRIIRYGIPKPVAVRSLLVVENILKKVNLIIPN